MTLLPWGKKRQQQMADVAARLLARQSESMDP
jgi:hypothetical protein